jgi:hypothetical protein
VDAPQGASFGLIGGVGSAGQPYIPGRQTRADRTAETGLYEDGKKSPAGPASQALSPVSCRQQIEELRIESCAVLNHTGLIGEPDVAFRFGGTPLEVAERGQRGVSGFEILGASSGRNGRGVARRTQGVCNRSNRLSYSLYGGGVTGRRSGQHRVKTTDRPGEEPMDSDYIIVGGGSAGSVLGNRLSARGTNKVLICEAGQDTPPGNVPKEILDSYSGAAYARQALPLGGAKGHHRGCVPQRPERAETTSAQIRTSPRTRWRFVDQWADGQSGRANRLG